MSDDDDTKQTLFRTGEGAGEVLAHIFRHRKSTGTAEYTTPHDRLLHCIACDYGSHALILETLIEILIRKKIMDEDEFEEVLNAIDARDGKIDGTLVDPTYLGEGI